MGGNTGSVPMETQHDLSRELERTREKLATLTEEARRNMQILRRSQRRELGLLQAEDLATLLRRMTNGLAQSYELEQVTVVIADPDHELRHLLLAGGASTEDIPGLMFVDGLAGLTPQHIALRTPWLGRYKASDHQLILPQAGGLGSIALIPLIHHGALFGSINFASADETRFTHGHASDFFAHLGVIAAIALENAVNRARLLRSGFTDVLTGWHNRRFLQLRLHEELARAQRDGSTLSCLMLDIDHFKNINDNWGHAAGDQALCEVAQRIEAEIRVSDIAARYGGEEFMVLLPNTDADSGRVLADRVRRAVRASAVEIGNERLVQITASIGIASVAPESQESELKILGEALLARADVALYKAKRAGRDRSAFQGDDTSAVVA